MIGVKSYGVLVLSPYHLPAAYQHSDNLFQLEALILNFQVLQRWRQVSKNFNAIAFEKQKTICLTIIATLQT